MREVIWTDGSGFKHRALLRSSDHLSRAAEGIPLDPPDVRELNWDEIVKSLHNLLVERRLVSLKDLSEKPGQLENSILAVIRTDLINLYKEKEREGVSHGD